MLDASKPSSPAERALLERLQERRQEIEARARELEIRDGMLKAAEMRLEARLTELKEMEARVNAAMQAKDDQDNARFKGLVTMYENMKAKDAAKIFDRLVDIAGCKGRSECIEQVGKFLVRGLVEHRVPPKVSSST